MLALEQYEEIYQLLTISTNNTQTTVQQYNPLIQFICPLLPFNNPLIHHPIINTSIHPLSHPVSIHYTGNVQQQLPVK